ncbi:anaphase promoting complex subunit 4 apc4 [Holotrichia oblita]|uniref:Anaphase promoting complex subunit 4 apc4 n=1 Tax=Holotrichia oblita TaxID=644536 RepID=A0ACB9SY13_HOLOL|nr:anaphase promoting complex subunit 4 apc4 [Holotrichia oblita]
MATKLTLAEKVEIIRLVRDNVRSTRILGLNEDEVIEAISAGGAFLNKSGEMQQIINTSMINYKAFFRWLYSAIVHLIDEQISPEVPKMTQQDVAHITEFLLNFDDIGTINIPDGIRKPKFIMEKLGQYLMDAPLTIPFEIHANEWNTFLHQNECFKNNASIMKHFNDTSLIQQFNMLKKSVSNIFDKLQYSLVDEFRAIHVVDIMNFPHSTLKITSISSGPYTVLLGLLLSSPSSSYFYFLETNNEHFVSIKAGTVYVSHQESESQAKNYEILDLQFYTNNILSLLLQENNSTKTAVMYQCPTLVLREKIENIDIKVPISEQNLVKINANSGGNCALKTLDGMVASTFAVSGFRNVSVVLADSRRKVRIYEMEAEEDEEEDAEMTNSTVRESDVSMPENSDCD